MKIVVTGSLGHVSKPLTRQLIEKGHSVTVISSKAEKQKDIEALGAKAAIGRMQDAGFLASTFAGADAVYCMYATARGFFDPNYGIKEIEAGVDKISHNYLKAIQQTGVKRVVYLSTIGAHMNKDNGLLAFHHHAENIFRKLPSDVSLTFLRPVGFYDNLLNFIPGIKAQGVIASSYGGDDLALQVSPIDIATAAAEELEASTGKVSDSVAAEKLTSSAAGGKIRYVASEEITCRDTASILGAAIGKPDLQWILLTDEQLLNGMKAFGMNLSIAESFVEMNANIHNGKIYEDYYLHRPVLGTTKLTSFAKQFAEAYNQQ